MVQYGPGNRKGIKEYRRQMAMKANKGVLKKNTKKVIVTNKVNMNYIPDPTVKILNSRKVHAVFFERTLGENVTAILAPTSTPAIAYTFDPAGAYGNNGFGGVPIAMPDWASFAAIYNQYKVKYIKVVFRFSDTSNNANIIFPLWVRYNYETSVATPTMAGVNQLNRCVMKTFNNDNPELSYKFYPKVAYDIQNGAILASQGKGMKPQPWTDVTFNPLLYGLQVCSDTALTANQTIYMTVTYGIKYRYNK